MQNREELDAELRRRIEALESQSNFSLRYLNSLRPILYEACIWVLGALLVWVAAVTLV